MTVVVGGGVVGLAIARALALRGRAVSVLERHTRTGQEMSTHNSGVIHAGLYYPADSLKAQLSAEGRARLYRYCRDAEIPHSRCGKLIVAQAGEEASLDAVARSAHDAGAVIQEVDREFVRRQEPHVNAARALWSPETGWLDAAAFVRALERDVKQHDGIVLTGSPVIAFDGTPDGPIVVTPHERIAASAVVNAAGLYADDVAALAGGEKFRIYPCRGEYAELAGSARGLVRGLVYPVPHA